MIKCLVCQKKTAYLFHQTGEYSYYLCNHCKTLFLNPFPKTQKLKKYYRSEFKFEAGQKNEPRTRLQAKKIIKSLVQLRPSGKKLLDIGSGPGFFLTEAADKGLNVCGIEPSSYLAKISSIKHLIKVFSLEFDQFYQRYKKIRFDFIVLNHVIEHLKSPKKTLIKISSLLNKNGILYVETPNLNSHLFRAERKDYTFLTPPEHLWIFSVKSFQTIIKDIAGLKIIKASTYSYPEHLMGILKIKINKRGSKIKQNLKNMNNISSSNVQPSISILRKVKYIVFDQILSPLLTPVLNIKDQGSFLEIYFQKK